MIWSYDFKGASHDFANLPPESPPGSIIHCIGVDGRFDGVLRRYPGHIRPYITKTTTGITSYYTPAFARYFEIQSEDGPGTRISGFVLKEAAGTDIQLWFRKSSDTSDVLRQQSLDLTMVSTVLQRDESNVLISGEYSPGGHYYTYGSLTDKDSVLCMLNWTHPEYGPGTVVAGQIRRLNGILCNNIAFCTHDGKWRTLGYGFSGPVRALCLVGSDLYAAGDFLYSGTNKCRKIAKWNKDSWQEVGGGLGGLSSSVFALAWLNGTTLWVGGNFDRYNVASDGVGTLCSPLLSIDVSTGTWTNAGGTFTGSDVRALCFVTDTIANPDISYLLAGGTFTQIASTSANNIAKRDMNSTVWSACQTSGANGVVRTIVPTFGNETGLVESAAVGGDFTTVGGSSYKYMALYNPRGDAFNDAFQYWSSDTSRGAVGALICNTNRVQVGPTAGGLLQCVISSGTPTWTTRFAAARGTVTAMAWNPLSISGTGTGALWFGGVGFNNSGSSFDTFYAYGVSDDIPMQLDVTSRGRYLYITMSTGPCAVLTLNETTNVFEVSEFGPGYLSLTQPSNATANTGGGERLIKGSYQGAYRYIDPLRGRYTAVSPPSDDVSLSADNYSYTLSGGLVISNAWPPPGFTHMEVFTTISNLDPGKKAGGRLKPAWIGSSNLSSDGTAAAWSVRIGASEFLDGGKGIGKSALSDASLAGLPDYDPLLEDVDQLIEPYGIVYYQGMLVALNRTNDFLEIAWSNPVRFEPESFSQYNRAPTGIKVSQATTCRFFVVGDFLYLLGGSRVYRIVKNGATVAVQEVISNVPWVHREAMALVGSTIYAMSVRGLWQIDGRSGSAAPVRGLDNLFYDYWRNDLTVQDFVTWGTTDPKIWMAFDARMNCIYILNRTRYQAVCLWLGTGKVTMLVGVGSLAMASGPDLTDGGVERAYFFTHGDVNVPNWSEDSSYPFTMSGALVATASGVGYNAEVLGTNPSGTHLQLSTTDYIFGSLNYSLGVMVVPITGNAKGVGRFITGESGGPSSYSIVVGDGWGSDIAVGDIVAIDPVVFRVVGSKLSGGSQLDLVTRRLMKGQCVVADRQMVGEEPSGTESLTPVDDYPIVEYAGIRYGDIVAAIAAMSDPNADVDDAKLMGFRYLTTPAGSRAVFGGTADGQALDSDKPSNNWGVVSTDGCALFPVIEVLHSNLGFELHQWLVDGSLETSLISGPGTN